MGRTEQPASGRDVARRYLEIKTEWRPGDVLVVVRLTGEIGADGSRTLEHWLRTRIPAESRYVVVDLSGVSLLGAPGVRVLVEHTDRQALAGRRMLTVAGNSHVRRILRLLRVTTVVGEYDSVPLAIAACIPSSRSAGLALPDDDQPVVTGGADGEMVSLRQEVLSLRAALRTRPVITRAAGVLQERYGLPDFEAAFGLLRESAQHHDLKPETLARELLLAPAPRAEIWFPDRVRLPAPSLSFSQQRRQHKRNRTAVLGLFLSAVLGYMQTPMADVQLVDAPGRRPRLELYRNLPPDIADHLADLDDPEATAAQAVTRGTRLVEDVSTDSGHTSSVTLAKAGIRTVQCTPLLAQDDHCVGVVSTYHSEPGFRPGRLQCAKVDHAAAETGLWLAWHRRTVIVDALEQLHRHGLGTLIVAERPGIRVPPL